MTIVISGIFGFRNRGVEALVVPAIESLQHQDSQVPISILSRTPDYDSSRLAQYNNVDLVERTISYQSLGRRHRTLAKLPFYKAPEPRGTTAVETLRKASMVLASGGDVFSSDYGSLNNHLEPLRIARSAGIPFGFLAHSIGPFKSAAEAQAFIEVAQDASLLTVREPISYQYLTKDLGLSTELVKHTADTAFLLQPTAPEKVDEMLQFYNIDRSKPTVAVAVSQGITTFSGCNYDEHLKAWYQVVKFLVDELGVQVLIIPHVQETYWKNDDRIMATNLLRLMNFHPQVRLAGGDHSASEFKGMIGACDMVIAERMHAAIAGLSSKVCTLAIGYSIKAEGIMIDLVGEDLLHQGLLMPIQHFLDPDKVCTAIETAWSQRHSVAQVLQEKLPFVQQQSKKNFEMIAKILNR